MPTEAQQYQSSHPKKQVDPLAHLLVQYLNEAGTLPSNELDNAGNTLPLLKQLLKAGYTYHDTGGSNPFLGNTGDMLPGTMSDQQALDSLIHAARGGKNVLATSAKADPTGLGSVLHGMGDISTLIPAQKPGTASGNILKELVASREALGETPKEARQSVQNLVGGELASMKQAQKLAPQVKAIQSDPTLSAAEKQAAEARLSPGTGATGSAIASNPQSLAQAIYSAGQDQIKSNYAQGFANIEQYNNEAQLMSQTIPEELRPIFNAQVEQRKTEMANDLNMTRDDANFQPFVDQLALASKAYLKGPKASSAQSLNTALGLLSKASSGTGGNLTPISSKSALSGYDVGNQLAEALKWYGGIGGDYAKFNKFVTSPSQISELQNFIPKSKTSYKALPTFLKILGG